VTPGWAIRPTPTGTRTRSPSAYRKSGCLLPRSPEAVLELEAELDGPSGFAVDTSTCPAGNADDCTYGRQETLHFRPKKAGTYTIRVYVQFAVSNVHASGDSYDSSANHDPDTDSNGTTITVTRP
jgi:hypothetical protein